MTLRPVALRPCLSTSVPLSYETASLHGVPNAVNVPEQANYLLLNRIARMGKRHQMQLLLPGQAVEFPAGRGVHKPNADLSAMFC